MGIITGIVNTDVLGYTEGAIYTWDASVPYYSDFVTIHPGTIDISRLKCGDFLGQDATHPNARYYGTSGAEVGWDDNYILWVGNANTNGDALDGLWVQNYGDSGWWDMGTPTRTVAVFLAQDHGPYLAEGLEYRIYGSNTLWGDATGPAVLTDVYLDGWRPHDPAEDKNKNEWCGDDISAIFDLGGFYRYIKLEAWATTGTLNEPEVDAVCSVILTPDLIISSIDISAVDSDCQTSNIMGTISAVVENIGGSDCENGFSVVFFEDENVDGIFDPNIDNVLGEVDESSLAAGSSVIVSSPVNNKIAFHGNLIYAFVDSTNQIIEVDETNNYYHTGLACEFEPIIEIYEPRLEWSWTSSEVFPDYLNVMMSPAVIDLNNDGISDIVFGATRSRGGGNIETGVLRALSGDEGYELFTITDPELNVNTASPVAVGDIDLDSRPEIIACDTSGRRLIAFEHDGTFKWRSPVLEAIYWGAPALADMDSDGIPEIVIGRQVLNNDGSIRWTGKGGHGSPFGTGYQLSLVADINMDGTPDVVAGNTVYTAFGNILWQAAVHDGYNAVANFDDDPFPEIVLVAAGAVYLLEHDGSVEWGPVSLPGGGTGGPPTIADYDSDGEVEIGVAGRNRYTVFETDGRIKWESKTQDSSSSVTGSSVFDFEGDGESEVVYSDELALRIYRGVDGFTLFEMPMSSCTWHEYPLVADVDSDGNAEIVVVANNNCNYGDQRGVFVFGSESWVSTRKIWNQHTYHITNINDDGKIPAIEVNNWELYNNYRQNVQTQGSVFAAPDLTASFLRLVDGDPTSFGIVARIGNGGSNVAAAPIDVAFYDGNDGILLGVVETTKNLKPGQFEDVILVLNSDITSTDAICAVADDDGTGMGSISECNEDNNQCCSHFKCSLTVKVFTSYADSPSRGGSVPKPGVGKHTYYCGEVVPIEAEPNLCYEFKGWTGTAVDRGNVTEPGEAETEVLVDGNDTLIANFAFENLPDVSYTEGSTVEIVDINDWSGCEKLVTVEARPEPCYKFTGWSGSAVDEGKVDPNAPARTGFLADKKYTLKAHFEPTMIEDDFESYNDIDPNQPGSNRIFDVWVDGFGNDTNGALVGNLFPPYAERRVVHGGRQSMPYSYNNDMKISEATKKVDCPCDWSEAGAGVTTLSLWFRGSPSNSPEPMFVALNGYAVVYHDDPAATRITVWTEWSIDLQVFADQGVDLRNVDTITIGFGMKNAPTAGSQGKVYFDDICLLLPAE